MTLAKVMTDANRAEVLPQFFHCSKQEAREVAAAIAPGAVVPRKTVVTEVGGKAAAGDQSVPPASSSALAGRVRPGELAATIPEEKRRTTVDPLSSSLRRLHLTVSSGLLDKPKRARAGQSHVQPGASGEQVIDGALDLLLTQQVKRKASVPTEEGLRRRSHRPLRPPHAGARRGVELAPPTSPTRSSR
ncbi:MAG: hypothetical protein WB493_01760 [Anaeromyxobacteraceae bacterium]